MNDYAQPDFYRFNQDSLALIKFIKQQLPAASSILDLGAGCGIIGIELARFFAAASLTLLELQPDYLSYLQENLRVFLPAHTRAELIFASFGQWQISAKWDLIVCNPPYYLPGHGQLSQDPRRHLARTFQQDNWVSLLGVFVRALTPKGVGYLVIKNDLKILQQVSMAIQGQQQKLVHEFNQQDDLVILKIQLD
jgi:tRNA1Val (adenine37-N6)-methyltransferase